MQSAPNGNPLAQGTSLMPPLLPTPVQSQEQWREQSDLGSAGEGRCEAVRHCWERRGGARRGRKEERLAAGWGPQNVQRFFLAAKVGAAALPSFTSVPDPSPTALLSEVLKTMPPAPPGAQLNPAGPPLKGVGGSSELQCRVPTGGFA